MTKKIFSFFLFFSSFNLVTEYSFEFKIDKNFAFPESQAKAEANKIIAENAYLAFHDKSPIKKNCWENYLKNKRIKFEIKESKVEIVNFSEKIYRVKFDPNKINFEYDHSNYLDSGC